MSIKSVLRSIFKKKKGNPFEAIAEFYNKQVEECDKAGYADTLKECAKLFFKEINDNLVEEPVHFEDIEYLDGHFIFGSGTNSIVHFHIKECPGWKFAIWWNIPDGSNPEQKYIDGDFFTQYEEIIDKFKPSRSNISSKITARPDIGENSYCSCWEAARLIEFIRKEPYLAFCRDYNAWDYNTVFHTREEAKQEYDEWRRRKDNEDEFTEILNEKMLLFVRAKILPLFADSEIYDNGDYCSPRYEVIAPYKSNKSLVKKPGWYDWFSDDDEEGQKILEEFKALEKECDDIADKYEFCWFKPIHENIGFYDKK